MANETPLPGYEKVQRASEVFPGATLDSWIALISPKGVPAEMVKRLNAAMETVVRDPEFAKRLLALGWANREGARSPRAIADHAVSERARWAEVVRDAGVKPQ